MVTMFDLELARALARKFHAGQLYGSRDYMYHLEGVRESVSNELENGMLYQVVALLHDILEDTALDYETLKSLFGDEVAEAVDAVSKMPTDFNGNEEPYEEYIARVRANPIALVVKRHDTVFNLRESTIARNQRRIDKYTKQLQLLSEQWHNVDFNQI